MVDTRDLKSLEHCAHTGSSPVFGTERSLAEVLQGSSFLMLIERKTPQRLGKLPVTIGKTLRSAFFSDYIFATVKKTTTEY